MISYWCTVTSPITETQYYNTHSELRSAHGVALLKPSSVEKTNAEEQNQPSHKWAFAHHPKPSLGYWTLINQNNHAGDTARITFLPELVFFFFLKLSCCNTFSPPLVLLGTTTYRVLGHQGTLKGNKNLLQKTWKQGFCLPLQKQKQQQKKQQHSNSQAYKPTRHLKNSINCKVQITQQL